MIPQESAAVIPAMIESGIVYHVIDPIASIVPAFRLAVEPDSDQRLVCRHPSLAG